MKSKRKCGGKVMIGEVSAGDLVVIDGKEYIALSKNNYNDLGNITSSFDGGNGTRGPLHVYRYVASLDNGEVSARMPTEMVYAYSNATFDY